MARLSRTPLRVLVVVFLLNPVGCFRHFDLGQGYESLEADAHLDGLSHDTSDDFSDSDITDSSTPTDGGGDDGGGDGGGDGGLDGDSDGDDGGSDGAVEWVSITAGSFEMGSDLRANEQPIHTVNVPLFELTQTEVTVAQYWECMDAGTCTEPATWSERCYWNSSGYDRHPVNCVSWDQAVAYCTWAGGRLPSEAEWEYAARSRGEDFIYPWGDTTPSCDYAVMDDGGEGCGTGGPWPVCSKPDGNTVEGLCDMTGNVFEWMQDNWHSTYDGAPTDGSAWGSGGLPLVRGGGYINSIDYQIRTTGRGVYFGTTYNNLFIGFRCAREAR